MILTVGLKGLSPDGNILCPSAKLACLFHDKAMSALARQRYALFHYHALFDYLKLCVTFLMKTSHYSRTSLNEPQISGCTLFNAQCMHLGKVVIHVLDRLKGGVTMQRSQNR